MNRALVEVLQQRAARHLITVKLMDKLTVDGRIATFKKGNWPHAGKSPKYAATPETLSQAGFYYRPMADSPDNCCCFLCQKNLDGWEAGDEAWTEHVKHAPQCALVRLDVETNRLATFMGGKLWPHPAGSSLAPERLAKAGFFYWPKLTSSRDFTDDTCICFQCGLALDGWEAEDDPRMEHAKRRPDCPFIRSGIALRPCSFEFILASKPDRNAVTHISASAKNANSGGGDAFKVPRFNKRRGTMVGGKAEAIPATPQKTPLPVMPSTTASTARKRGRPRKTSIIPQTPQPSLTAVEPLDPELVAYLTPEALELPFRQLLPLLANRAVASFDARARTLSWAAC